MFEQPSRTDRDGPEDSSEQQLAADADVVVLRIAIAFFTIGLCIETEVVSHLPVTIDAVIEARAINVSSANAGLAAIDTRIGNRLIAAKEFMLDAAKQGDLGKLFKNPCSQAELNKIVPFGFSLQRQKNGVFLPLK